MIKIVILGADGQVGMAFQSLSKDFPDYHFYFVNRQILDITDKEAVWALFSKIKPDYCVNCAAYTAVDRAEIEKEKAHLVNVIATHHLGSACQEYNVFLIHLSTDYVYHNNQNRPFDEKDETNPKGIYAVTKLEGEEAALRTCLKTIIIRTSWVYAAQGHNFVRTMLRLGQERDELKVVFDQIGTPTYADDLAEALLQIIDQLSESIYAHEHFRGIYHYSNEGVCSWYDFAKAIFDIKNINCTVIPIETTEFPTPASRPPFSLLNKKKIKTLFHLEIPYWRDSLKKCLESM